MIPTPVHSLTLHAGFVASAALLSFGTLVVAVAPLVAHAATPSRIVDLPRVLVVGSRASAVVELPRVLVAAHRRSGQVLATRAAAVKPV